MAGREIERDREEERRKVRRVKAKVVPSLTLEASQGPAMR